MNTLQLFLSAVKSYVDERLHLFSGTFPKFRKATISFVVSVRLFVSPSVWNNSAPTGWIFMKFEMSFSKICRENSSFNTIWQKKIESFTWRKIHILCRNLLSSSYSEKCLTKFVEKIEKRKFNFNKLSRQSGRLRDSVEKYCRARQATVDNMAHAHHMLDT